MARHSYDGVIEAVRYAPDGQIEFVRAYERRGAAFSDHVLLTRPALLERLKAKKRFVTGQRRPLLAGTFDSRRAVNLVRREGREFISTREAASGDELEGVPFL